MLGKNDLHEALQLECRIIEHLYRKLPGDDRAAALAYRPTPDQRSLLELLQYLSYCGLGGCHAALDGGWDNYRKVAQQGEETTDANFLDRMAAQRAAITDLLEPVSDEELASRETKNPIGETLNLGNALVQLPLRWLIAYRMQLFLYARALGADVWTPDCWYGIHRDRPAPKS